MKAVTCLQTPYVQILLYKGTDSRTQSGWGSSGGFFWRIHFGRWFSSLGTPNRHGLQAMTAPCSRGSPLWTSQSMTQPSQGPGPWQRELLAALGSSSFHHASVSVGGQPASCPTPV